MKQQTRRCAIYTRKSTEEGLDQAFNSLDAQREACEAYIKSQAHEGWKLIKTAYDDGGFSGGSMERPAVQRLMTDLKQGLIDIVVVYKVDRLTRSLADFAKIVEIVDVHGASFVSVTQQFNTTTSMGRLTLNVLLSFAQFEREVTGERIRDKIAASKRKGMWMGGTVPFGYDVKDRQLVVNEAEAETVRRMFNRYLELGCVNLLAAELREEGVVSKLKVSRRGNQSGGQPFERGALYHLLQNQIYLGMVCHKGEAHPGQHPAIVPQELWEAVQRALASSRVMRRNVRLAERAHMLVGKLKDSRGVSMVPVSTHKANGQRYRYYVSGDLVRGRKSNEAGVMRLPADELEQLVEREIRRRLPNVEARQWDTATIEERWRRINAAISAVTIRTTEIELALTDGEAVCIPATLNLRASGATIVRADGNAGYAKIDRALVRAVVLASYWRELLETGEARTPHDIARLEGCRVSYVQRHLPLAFLAPRLIESIINGQQPSSLALSGLIERPPGPSWTAHASAA
jgi:DNA invertase Pin-like site-specific DNA recombinase